MLGENIPLPAHLKSVWTFLPVLKSRIKLQFEDKCVFSRKSPNPSLPRPKSFLRGTVAVEQAPFLSPAPSHSLPKASYGGRLFSPVAKYGRRSGRVSRQLAARNPLLQAPHGPTTLPLQSPVWNKDIPPATPIWRSGSQILESTGTAYKGL